LQLASYSVMLMHHSLDCAKSRLNPESHWLVNGTFLLT